MELLQWEKPIKSPSILNTCSMLQYRLNILLITLIANLSSCVYFNHSSSMKLSNKNFGDEDKSITYDMMQKLGRSFIGKSVSEIEINPTFRKYIRYNLSASLLKKNHYSIAYYTVKKNNGNVYIFAFGSDRFTIINEYSVTKFDSCLGPLLYTHQR